MKNWEILFHREKELAVGIWLMRGWFGFQFFILKFVIRSISEFEKKEAEIALRSKMDAAKDGEIVPMSKAEMKTYERMSRK